MPRPNSLYRAGTLVLALLLLAIVVIAEIDQYGQRVINERIRLAQQREVALADLLGELHGAQAAEHDLFLTGATAYLDNYRQVRAHFQATLAQVDDLFRQDHPPSGPQQPQWGVQLHALAQTRLQELDASLARYRSLPPSAQVLPLLQADAGSSVMTRLRIDVLQLRDVERGAIDTALAHEERLRIQFRVLLLAVACLNVLLLVAIGMLLARSTRRNRELTVRLEIENQELERRVLERTEELSALSSHLQQLSETEKASLARELHDELGGLLIAVKMDVAWLQKRALEADQAAQARFNRILKVLDDGVDFKRRVVENLRPTLLDNMGLFPALRWVTQETCSRAGLRYTEKYPDLEPLLRDTAAITIFRLAQESLINIVKHACATEVRLTVALNDSELTLTVEDDGRGIATQRNYATGAHGLATMRHRVRSLGGKLSFAAPAGGGTRVLAQLPLSTVLQAPVPDVATDR